MVDDGAISPERLMGPPFPSVPQKSQRHYVLDGHQRLACLYGALYGDENDTRFGVAFDLRTEEFDFENQMPEDGAWIRLTDLFAPKSFMRRQKTISSLPDGDALIDKSIILHSAFQEYMIPLVTIADRDVSEVVQIFERINSTGTKLDAVDFLRALTWSQGFDLNSHVNELARLAMREGFQFGAERLARLFAVVMDKDPTAEDMMSLRNYSAVELGVGIDKTKKVLEKACAFFRDEANVHSADLVPYDAQLLVVGRLFATTGLNPNQVARRQVARWLLASSLNEEFQGKADHRVARIVRSVNVDQNGGSSLLSSDLNVTADALLERRLLRGGALSGGISLLFARQQPRSLITGNEIQTDLYLTPEQFAALVPLEGLARALRRAPQSPKVLANLVLCGDAAEARQLQRNGLEGALSSLEKRLGKNNTQRILSSQLLSVEALDLLKKRKTGAFLRHRAQDMLSAAVDAVAA
jgi:hypothetical protein